MKTKLFSVLFMLCNISVCAAAQVDSADFYQLPVHTKVGQHGQIIKSMSIKTTIPNARAWKVMYWSSSINSQLVPVSAIVIAPLNTSAKSPIITWAHGTTGSATKCAPSIPSNPAQDINSYYAPNNDSDIDYGIPSLTQMIKRGYVVAATDYMGLGVESGTHPYLIGEIEAKNVLDAAIAAKHLTNSSANTIAFGWSQGGHSALWTANFANYASPDINLLGVVALAPANPPAEAKVMEEMLASGYKLRPIALSELFMSWYAMSSLYPELKLSDKLTPVGINYIKQAMKSQCNNHMGDSILYFEQNSGAIVNSKPKNSKAWQKRYNQNSLEQISSKVPFAIYQGESDTTVFPPATNDYIKYACTKGTTVAYKSYPNIDHIKIVDTSQKEYLQWIQDRFAGKIAPTTCNVK